MRVGEEKGKIKIIANCCVMEENKLKKGNKIFIHGNDEEAEFALDGNCKDGIKFKQKAEIIDNQCL